MIEIEEKLDLVKEGDEWRIFSIGRPALKYPSDLSSPMQGIWTQLYPKAKWLSNPETCSRFSSRSKIAPVSPSSPRIGHLGGAGDVTNFLDFVECGFLLPITLQPGKEEEYSARYLLRGSLPEGVHQLNLTYDFRLLK